MKIPSLFLLTALLVGCAGTRAAYQAAEDFEDTAYVMSEHYDALVVEGIRLRDSGVLSGNALNVAQRIEARARPIMLNMGRAAQAWESVRSAENQAALELAISEAVKVLHELIDALKTGEQSTQLLRIEARLAEVAS